MRKPDFVAKYGPLLHMLDGGEDDFATLAAESRYTRDTGRHWRDGHCRAVLGYIRTLRADYEVIWQQVSGHAVLDASLGELLGQTESRMKRLVWRLRIYALVQRLAPVPHQGRIPRLRSLVLKALPTVESLEVEQVLLGLETLHQRGGARVFLP